jgi:aspartyl-tRNA(Asn)/glutamyl-tRNA(Gln) amidotransferase subunit C
MEGGAAPQSVFGRETLARVARLARIRLTEEEMQTFTRDLGRVLQAAQALEQLDLSQAEAVYTVVPMEEGEAAPEGAVGLPGSRLREDVPASSLELGAWLGQAPWPEAPYVAVPEVVSRS